MEIFQTFAKIYKVIRVKYIYTCDGVQGMLPPYMALSHIEFKVEGVWEAGSRFWPPPPVPFFSETGHKTLLWEKACLYQGKEHPCLWRQTDRKEDPNKQDSVSFPQFTPFTSYSLTCHIYYCLLFIKALVAQMAKNLPTIQETEVWLLGQENPWRRKWLPTPVFLPEEFHREEPDSDPFTFTLHQTA